VEIFAGKVILLGRRYGVPTPVNQRLFDRIREIEAGKISIGS
jgi:2-dehydropantoate 2-reductase